MLDGIGGRGGEKSISNRIASAKALRRKELGIFKHWREGWWGWKIVSKEQMEPEEAMRLKETTPSGVL